MKKYDVIIIGSGQAGNPLAMAMGQAGKKTLLIEKRLVGGTCVNDGCTPTKAMIGSGRIAWLASKSNDWGVHTGKVTSNLKAIKNRKDVIVASFRKGNIKGLKDTPNVELLMGTAHFVDKKKIEILTDDGKKTQAHADLIFINTGTIPQIPAIDGLKDCPYLTSTQILDLVEIPKELIIVGAGYIALELGQLYSRMGAKVTLLENGDVFLPKEDRDIAQSLYDILTEEGLTIELNAKINQVSQTKNKKITVSYRQSKQHKELRGSHILIAAGRKAQTEQLNLSATGVKTANNGFVKVNTKLETNVKGIYALGDVKGGPAFTHISYNDFVVVSRNLLANKNLSIRNRMVPYVVFTDPQLARIGITEKEAKDKKLNYKIAVLPMENVARGIEVGETRGMMKAIVDAKNNRILGAAIIGAEGGEIMSVLQMAMMGKISTETIRYGVFAHPTYAESLMNLFMNFKN
ncbi:mercuric reductase [Olivibacter sp. SDN3]|uniref:mercuric reductase n=1 Tax=Olivibacter sp. SDN3 TaxID=2764720 RepID=UPI0016517C2E|nr:mercuric reductase [Olivibacter sp. SDN3]QNL49664.1 mercuric reductase [Olivibacter sp. SDN3]